MPFFFKLIIPDQIKLAERSDILYLSIVNRQSSIVNRQSRFLKLVLAKDRFKGRFIKHARLQHRHNLTGVEPFKMDGAGATRCYA